MLNLNDAKLEGTIPESLGNVATLTHVYLASNSFQGPVPTSVANLPNLQVIDLTFNKLNGPLPQFVSSAMTTMELGHNQFTGPLSANAADGMTGLEIFDIKYNLVTGTIPSFTTSLPSLVELDLSNNQFLGESCWFACYILTVSYSNLLTTFQTMHRYNSGIYRSAWCSSATLS